MIKSSITNIILDFTLYALLSVIWLSVPSYSWAKGDDRLITNRSVLYIPHSVHHGHCKKAVDIGINPSSPNIHIQILQTDLHIFPYRIRREIDKRSRHFGPYNFRQTTSSGFKPGYFKDKLQSSRPKIYSMNRHSLTPLDHPIGLNTPWSHLRFLLLRPSLIT